jgi:hypothetical protein
MDLPKLLTDFQVRFGDKLAELTNFLGSYYANWDHFKQLVINIAEKLGNIKYSNLLPECLYILMNHEFKPKIWDAGSFVLFLNYVDKELTKMFFCIINAIINHPNFGPYCVYHRRNCVIQLGYRPKYTRDWTKKYTRDWSCKLEYNGFEFYDALVEINAHFLKFIPFHRPMPFFQSRLRLCELDDAQFLKSSLAKRQQMLVISGLSRLIVSRLFFKDTRLSRQMKQILEQNF